MPGLEFQLAREAVLNPGERITVTDTDAVTGALRTIAPALNLAIADLVKHLAPRMTPPDPQTREIRLGSTALPPTAGRVRDALVSARHLERQALVLECHAESAGNVGASARAAALARRAREIQRGLPTPESAKSARKGAVAGAGVRRRKAEQEELRLLRFLELIEEVLLAERRHGRHPTGVACAMSARGRTEYRDEDLDALADMIDVDTARQRTPPGVSRQARRQRSLAAIRTAIRRRVTGGLDALT